MAFLAPNGKFQNYDPNYFKMFLSYTKIITKTSIDTLRSENWIFGDVLRFKCWPLCLCIGIYVCVHISIYIYVYVFMYQYFNS